ncbi:MAG TPA: PAS domain-containing protein [Burkholderiaceae bacterium]|nr:PAS domain-containing protein [Burkholderiaceae bacterium]
MNRIASLSSAASNLVWVALLAVGVVWAAWVWQWDATGRAEDRQSRLQVVAEKQAAEIAATTLNGDLMGSLVLLGIMDRDIKQDVTNGLLSIDAAIDATLGIVGGTFDARGVFVVSGDGIIKTSWASSGKPNSGANVRFRPYVQMALEGKTSVYAAVGTTSGERTLYYSAPVFAYASRTASGIGAVVAQAKVDWLDKRLSSQPGGAALLSPQGVVFAASELKWLGGLDGVAALDRLKAIRDLKQFGKWFDSAEPKTLPFRATGGVQALDGSRHAVAVADIHWGDPAGSWKLVLLEDLSHTVSVGSTLARAAAATLLYVFLAVLMVRLVNSHHRQTESARQLSVLADGQSRQLRFREDMSAAMIALQTCEATAPLAQAFLSHAHTLFGTLQGVVYVVDRQDAQRYVLKGQFACSNTPPAVLMSGEGVLGQCAVERTSRLLAGGQHGWGPVRSGLGGAAPGYVVCLPLLGNDQVLGLVEVTGLGPPEAFALGNFKDLANAMALNLQVLLKAEQTLASLQQTEHIRQLGAEQLHMQQSLVNAIPYPVFYKDHEGRFTGFNRAYEATFAVSRADLLGKTVMDLEYLPLEDRKVYDAEDMHLIRTGGSATHIMSMPFADGKVHRTLYHVMGFARPDGSPGGLVGTFTDLEWVDALAADHAARQQGGA